jgi:hypothetical protein
MRFVKNMQTRRVEALEFSEECMSEGEEVGSERRY